MRFVFPLALGLPVLMLCLIGCDAILNQLGFVSQRQIDEARERLDTMYRHLPAVPGAVLLQRVERSGGEQIDGCESVDIQELYGTNQISFDEVLDFYSKSLASEGAKLRLSSSNGRSFDINDFAFAVSAPPNVSLIDRNILSDAKSKFKTVYLIERNTLVIQPMPIRCKNDE